MKVMDFLCRGNTLQNLEGNQATLKKLADLLFISSEFDDLKVFCIIKQSFLFIYCINYRSAILIFKTIFLTTVEL